ncbi:hypothetical protein F4560_008639 [Saccharothrix ecbatanensis]|uniref:Uncharacterized protein n=1 Tax=Saccharothrix ecbatanensis TaxID=1105145 RepID=A0A7W9M652_9PSEU|nr:SNF2-related protein [Saccharothrix ecbatanensis]MBB5808871.1 hypothetical protein [Saccharothrix ecbatanensis]
MSGLWLNRAGQTIACRLRFWLTHQSARPDYIDLVAGYVSIRGLMSIEAELRRALDRGTQIRLLLAVTQDEAIWIRLPDPFTDSTDLLRHRLARNVDYLRTELSGMPMVRDAQVRLLGLAYLLRRPGFSCRRHETAFVHSKVFTQHGADDKPVAVIGSANLTLGGMIRNEECSSQVTGSDAQEAVDYATALWNEAVPFDLTAIIEEQFSNYPHELVFLRMLFELYGGDVNAEDKLSLAAWQRDGVARALAIAREYGGALIADDVGVGKTYEAAEIIRRGVYERGERAVVICPANLVRMWRHRLRGWNLPADVLSYHGLPVAVRTWEEAGEAALPYDLVVLDEAHWLRNRTTWRDALRVALASAASPPQVFALTATPIQNRGQDLVEVLGLALPRLTVQHRRALADLCRRADRLDREQLNDLHRLLDTMMVRRTRQGIKENYPQGFGDATLVFPEQLPQEVRYSLPPRLRTLVRDVLAALDVERADLPQSALDDYHALAPNEEPPAALTMAAYHLQDYQIHPADGRRSTSAFDWTRLSKCMLCKRLESSVAALASTLEAMRSRCADVLHDLDRGTVYLPTDRHLTLPGHAWDGTLDDNTLAGLETDEALERQPGSKRVAHRADLFAVSQLRQDLVHDIAILTGLRDTADSLIPEDPKMPVLINLATETVRHPDGPKLLIFTGSRVTGEFITAELERHIAGNPALAGYRGRIASLARKERPTDKQIQRTTADFAPQAADIAPGILADHYPRNRYDLLVCTDMLAEGINLQQTAFVIHFDLPWNPMMIGQRAGRANRLGSPYEHITCFSVFPDRSLDAQLHLLNRLYGKINVAAAAVGVPTPIIPGATVEPRDFTAAISSSEPAKDTFPAFDADVYRAMLGTALRTPGLGAAIRDFPRKAGGVAGDGRLRGFVFCFRVHTAPRHKTTLCTIFLNGASLVDQMSCIREAAASDIAGWLRRAGHEPHNLTEPSGTLPDDVLQHLWPALEQARKRVATLHHLTDHESDDQITVITWLALAALPSRRTARE